MERQSWCSHQSPVPIPLLFIIPAVADTPPRALSFFPLSRRDAADPKASDEATFQV